MWWQIDVRQRVSVIVLLVTVLQGVFGMQITAGSPASSASPLGGDQADPRLDAVDAGLEWLASMQQSDGGFGQGGNSDWLSTALTVQAFALRGYDAGQLESAAGNTAGDYLTARVGSIGSDADKIAQMILAGVALGEDPAAFAGRNWYTWLSGALGADGHYASATADAVESQVAAIAALRAGYRAVPAQAVAWLKNAGEVNGGWGASQANPSDAYHTGLALRGLILAGEPADSSIIQGGVAWLVQQQLPDGGFADAGGAASSPPATAAAALGLIAAGENILDAAWAPDAWSPLDALLSLQSSAGAFPSPQTGLPDVRSTLFGVMGLLGHVAPPRHPHLAAERAIAWLHTQQCRNNPGCNETLTGPGSFGPASTSSDAIVAIAAVGQDPDGAAWTAGGQSALDALEALTPSYVDRAGNRAAEAAKTARAAMAAGRDPRDFGGLDLIARIQSYYNPETGRYYDTWLYRHDLAVLALHAAGAPAPARARQTLVDEQHPNGGWGWAFAATVADVDSTGLTMLTLAETGYPLESAEYGKALTFLAGMQLADGSLPDRNNATVGNANSAALAIRGILAADKDPRELPFVQITPTGALVTLLDALLAFQEDSGAFIFTRAIPESRLLATLDTVPALVTAFPVYSPAVDTTLTVAGDAHIWSRSDGDLLVARYSGDGNDNGALNVRRWQAGEQTWSDPLPATRTVGAYLVPLDGARNVTLQVEYVDADGVEGRRVQTVHRTQTALSLITKR